MLGRAKRGESGWEERYPPPGAPWTQTYGVRHQALVCEALDDPRLIDAFRTRGPLPVGYGVGFDERVIEYPWLLAQRPGGRVLDAGSTLNHLHVLERLHPGMDALHVLTLAPEPVAFPERGISYVYGDIREMPYRDDFFDTVVCVSTLEHVGMDNSVYVAGHLADLDPQSQVERAVAELTRVARPGSTVLISVPFGRAEDHRWLRQFDQAGLEQLVGLFAPAETSVEIFAYTRRGWERSDFARAGGMRYRDYAADPRPVDDLAAAARAVACVRLRLAPPEAPASSPGPSAPR